MGGRAREMMGAGYPISKNMRKVEAQYLPFCQLLAEMPVKRERMVPETKRENFIFVVYFFVLFWFETE